MNLLQTTQEQRVAKKLQGVPHLRGSFLWVRLGSGPLHPGGLYLGWGQGPTPSTAFDNRDEQFASGWRRTREHDNWPLRL
ncbi:hypothetical protein F2Q68_00005716 [Brassica cretica]|uniref:Uncharacterized protein n=1 Tax=Brassica cretica TaxID=69181 RepID=A0A8S9JKD1_BRACR|nr:hypothetical protein F2Q68_00005716 [Brassica cretica]